jgi:hypothetical protein
MFLGSRASGMAQSGPSRDSDDISRQAVTKTDEIVRVEPQLQATRLLRPLFGIGSLPGLAAEAAGKPVRRAVLISDGGINFPIGLFETCSGHDSIPSPTRQR